LSNPIVRLLNVIDGVDYSIAGLADPIDGFPDPNVALADRIDPIRDAIAGVLDVIPTKKAARRRLRF